jgi:excisionase family DNA binding protein
MTRQDAHTNDFVRGIRVTGRLVEELDRRKDALIASELAELLAIDVKTVYKYAAKQMIPSFRIGRNVRFDPRILSEWLKTKMPTPISAPLPVRLAV